MSFKHLYYKIGLYGFWRAKNKIWLYSAKYSQWNDAKIDVFRVSIPRPLDISQYC